MAHGVFASMLVALRVLSFFVTCYRQMLAMLLLVWTTVWLISFGLAVDGRRGTSQLCDAPQQAQSVCRSPVSSEGRGAK